MGIYTKGEAYIGLNKKINKKKIIDGVSNIDDWIKEQGVELPFDTNLYNIHYDSSVRTILVYFDSSRYLNAEWQMDMIRDFLIDKYLDDIDDISIDLWSEAGGVHLCGREELDEWVKDNKIN